MSQIFELFGYPLEDQSREAQECRHSASCPFMGKECDGGGNRPQSITNLTKNEDLRKFFGNRTSVQAGVCSLQLTPGSRPWIVCPRRLLALKHNSNSFYQQELELALLRKLNYPSGTRLGVWAEVGLKFETDSGKVVIDIDVEAPSEVVGGDDEGIEPSGKSFDYRFDYIIMPINQIPILEVAQILGTTNIEKAMKTMNKAGYNVVIDHKGGHVEDFPYDHPYIIEIMTSSTSGGDQKKHTTIPMAFADAVLGQPHRGPGINYRQVWARMVSQLIVKSEVAIGWGGKTIWVVQDALVDYISKSTALDIRKFASEHISEVNMLSFSYGNNYKNPNGVVDLTDAKLFSGPIAKDDSEPGEIFLDILRTPIKPTLDRLVQALAQKKFVNTLIVP